jgi:hypothetical protein
MSRSRLAKLSHAQLVELAAEACEGSRELKNKADALIAQVAPLPAWCVDILMSPDLLPQLFSSLGLSEHAAASVCSTWSRAFSRQLRRCRYINPRRKRWLADAPEQPNGLCMLPGGVLAITSGEKGNTTVNFVAARSEYDPQALAAYRASSLAAQQFKWPMGMALTDDGLLVCNLDERSAALYKFALDGSMDKLATAPALDEYDRGFSRCAVHQQTQRTFALALEEGDDSNAVIILDSHLNVVATVEAAESWRGEAAIRDVAVHGDQVLVLTTDHHIKGSGLRLIDLDGQYLRTIAAGQLRSPQAVAASDGRAFVIDTYDEEDGEDEEDVDDDEDHRIRRALLVIDIHSGDILQQIRVDLVGEVAAVLVDGDEIYIAGFGASEVVVLPFAGSEA